MTKGSIEDCCAHFDLFENNFVPSKWPVNDVDFTVQTIIAILMTLKVTFLGLITDNGGSCLVNSLLLQLDDPSLRITMHVIDDSNSDATMKSHISMMQFQMEETMSIVLCSDPRNTLTAFAGLNASLDSTKQSGVEYKTRWLTLTSNTCFLPELEKAVFRLDNILVVAPIGVDQFEDVQELGLYTLHIQPPGRYLVEVGLSSRDSGLHINGTLFPNMGHGFNGRHFVIGVYVWDPFTMRVKDGNQTMYVGFCVDLVIELSRRLNFTFTLTEPPDNNWGSPTPDGNWTGLVGMLQKFEIDISVAALIITEEREEVMDATFPFYYDNVGILYKRLDPTDRMWETYFHPFKTEVFMCIGASLVLGCLIYLLLTLLTPSKTRISHKRRLSYTERIADIVSETDNIVTSLLQQGRPDIPTHSSGRTFLSFWWIFTMIIAAIYKGNLIAFLMVPQDELPFETLFDLATQNVYKWGVTGSTVVENLLQVSHRPDFKLLGQGIESFKAFDSNINSLDPLVHLAKVKAGHYAYISDMVPMEIWMSNDCDLRLLQETVIPLPFVVGLQNNSGFLSLFNKHLLDIDQIGLYNVWKQRWWPEMGRCNTGSQTAKKVLSLVETQSSFYALVAGIIVSTVCLVGEFFMTSRLYKEIESFIYTCYIKIQHAAFYPRR